MNKLPIASVLVLVLLVLSGYVSSNEKTEIARAEGTVRYADQHLNYYEAHLIAMGIRERRQ